MPLPTLRRYEAHRTLGHCWPGAARQQASEVLPCVPEPANSTRKFQVSRHASRYADSWSAPDVRTTRHTSQGLSWLSCQSHAIRSVSPRSRPVNRSAAEPQMYQTDGKCLSLAGMMTACWSSWRSGSRPTSVALSWDKMDLRLVCGTASSTTWDPRGSAAQARFWCRSVMWLRGSGAMIAAPANRC